MTDLRHRIARAIHRYDAEHAFSVNDLPSEHHYGEADAVLAVLADHDRDAARQTTGQDDTGPAPWTTDGRHGPTPEEASAAIGQCGKWGGCILDAGHTGLHRHTPRPADVEPYDHPGTTPAVGQPAEAHGTNSSTWWTIQAQKPTGTWFNLSEGFSSADEARAWRDTEVAEPRNWQVRIVRVDQTETVAVEDER